MAINPDHIEFAELATELITENGSEMTLRTETVATGWPPVSTISDQTITAVRTGNVSDSQIRNSDGRIKMGDANMLMDSTIAPTEAAKIIDGAKEYQIIDIGEVVPGDVSILFKLVVRA